MRAFIPLFLAAALAGCTQEKPVESVEGDFKGSRGEVSIYKSLSSNSQPNTFCIAVYLSSEREVDGMLLKGQTICVDAGLDRVYDDAVFRIEGAVFRTDYRRTYEYILRNSEYLKLDSVAHCYGANDIRDSVLEENGIQEKAVRVDVPTTVHTLQRK